MKLFFARGVALLALLALAAAGCAVGSAAELADDLSPATPPPLDPGPASPPAPGDGGEADGGADSSSSPAVDASVADALAAPDAVVTSACAFNGQLLAFNLGQAMGSQVDLLPSSKASGLGVSALRRGGVVAVATNSAMNASDWPTGAVDVAKHFTFTVTPPPGCALAAASLSVDLKASPTGPTSAAAATSADGFGALKSLPVSSAGGVAVAALLGGKASGAVEVRIFGFDASSSAGTLRLQGTLALTGSLAPL